MSLHEWADISGIVLVLMTGIGGIRALMSVSAKTGQTLEKMNHLEDGHEEIRTDVKDLSAKVDRCATSEDLAIVRDDLNGVRDIAIGSSQGRRYPTKY